jgi:hypothetical protein
MGSLSPHFPVSISEMTAMNHSALPGRVPCASACRSLLNLNALQPIAHLGGCRLQRRLVKSSLFALVVAMGAAGSAAGQECGSLESHYGPFDFRVNRDKLPIVENFHFSPKVQALVRGDTSATPGPDIEYVLKTFPNHPGALVAITKWARIKKSMQPSDLKYSVDCHFKRALRFRSDDAVVRMLYAQWLNQTSRKSEALQQVSSVEAKGNPQTIANLGLLYLELGEPEKALAQAHAVQALGYPVTMLKAALEKAGHWRDADPTSAEQPASAAGTSASAAAR